MSVAAAADPIPVRGVANRFACSTRHVYRLVDRGVVPRPERIAGRNVWSLAAVERAVAAWREHQPTNRCHARTGPSIARRVRQERVVLARMVLDCLEFAGPVVFLDVMRRHGAGHGLRGLSVEQLCRLTAELQAAAHLARGMR
jgi:predicted DNA-binding transcriptional regulator AlpA